MCLSAFNVFLYALFCHLFCRGHFFSHFKLTYFPFVLIHYDFPAQTTWKCNDRNLVPVFKTYNLIRLRHREKYYILTHAYFFLFATVLRGPLRVLALVFVFCPRTGRLLLWRIPR